MIDLVSRLNCIPMKRIACWQHGQQRVDNVRFISGNVGAILMNKAPAIASMSCICCRSLLKLPLSNPPFFNKKFVLDVIPLAVRALTLTRETQ